MKLLDFFKKKEQKRENTIADFFLHASSEEKQKVFTEAARRANEDQREVMRKAGVSLGSG